MWEPDAARTGVGRASARRLPRTGAAASPPRAPLWADPGVQGLSNLAWSLAQLRVLNEGFMTVLGRVLLRRVRDLNEQVRRGAAGRRAGVR